MKNFRWYLLIIFILIRVIISSAQQGKEKSEIQQEIQDLKNDIKELEAEIADAKINYPEDLPELQKDLEATKKMLSAFEKMAGVSPKSEANLPKATPVTKTNYNSSIVPINLNRAVIAPKPGEDTDRLLWYKGKRINDSTLITTKALVVQYQSKMNRVVAQPEKISDPFEKIIKELEKTEIRKDELLEEYLKAKNGFMHYPELSQAMLLYDDISERYNDVVKNTIEMPKPMVNVKNYDIKVKEKSLLKKDSEIAVELKQRWEKAFAEIIILIARLPNPENFPAPPAKEIGVCSTCDNKLIERERIQDSIWSSNFQNKEVEIITAIFVLVQEKNGFDADVSKELNLMSDMLKRMRKKAKILLDKYGNDLKYALGIIPTVLAIERQGQLLGLVDETDAISIDAATGLSAYEKYFYKQLDAKNYNFILDYAFHFAVARQKELLGIRESVKEVEQAKAFNRFRLELDFDFIYEQTDDEGKTEMKATGNISSKGDIYVKLMRDSCNWRMTMYTPDFDFANENNIAIPLFVNSGEKTIKVEGDKLETYSYTGPPDWKLQFPYFKIDFCISKRSDSAFLMPMNFEVGEKIALGNLSKAYKAEMLPLANYMIIDVNKMEDNATKGMELAAEIMDEISEPMTGNSSGYAKLDKLQKRYALKIKQDGYKKQISEIGMNKRSVFLFKVSSNTSVLIDKYNDTKYNIDENTKLLKGLIHLKVVHDPEKIQLNHK